MDIPQKNAIVTGISSGIGLALVQKLLNEGYRVVGTTRSGVLEAFEHPNLTVISLEVTDIENIKTATHNIKKLIGEVDLLINNAGVALDAFAINPDFETFTLTMDTNVTGVVFFTEQLLEHIKNGGQIVFISSNMSLIRNADVNGTAYRMSKAAINIYAVMLAKRLQERKIKSTPVHPGWVQTRLGGDKAQFTPAQSAERIYNGIIGDMESGKFYNINLPGTEEF